ncbi:L-rhamnose mutarotase [Ruania rhizosphaerae]|uniref:L-rhamnose mutarotase n=1 Tax=Ruania rhizosphaerae TaxID=1840413 RepID=UPI0013585AFB|nr:L-rhamnose mutarotase [Ruania rhizosphaerae]
MTIALHSRLKDGHEEAYERDHQRIPEDLAAEFARLGIHEWRIWRSGRDLFHLVECDDFEAAMIALETSPANARWQEFINQHLEGFATFTDGPAGTAVPQVWTLSGQISTS